MLTTLNVEEPEGCAHTTLQEEETTACEPKPCCTDEKGLRLPFKLKITILILFHLAFISIPWILFANYMQDSHRYVEKTIRVCPAGFNSSSVAPNLCCKIVENQPYCLQAEKVKIRHDWVLFTFLFYILASGPFSMGVEFLFLGLRKCSGAFLLWIISAAITFGLENRFSTAET